MADKTVVIWDDKGHEICFFVVDKDVTHLNGTYINGGCDYDVADELSAMIYAENSGLSYALKELNEFPVDVVMQGNVAVIVAGFLP